MLFVGIISWKGASHVNWGGGYFSDGEASFLSGEGGGAPWGVLVLMRGGDFRKKLLDWGGGEGTQPPPQAPSHYGKPWMILTCYMLVYKSIKNINRKVNFDLKNIIQWLRANKISLNADIRLSSYYSNQKNKVITKNLNF